METEPSPAFDLRAARLNAGLTMKKLSEITGLHRETIRHLEESGGSASNPASAKKVADYFGVAVTDLPGFRSAT